MKKERVKGKEGLFVYISSKVIKAIRKLAKEKHAKLRGGLSDEVEDALRNWLALHTIDNNQPLTVNKVNPGREFHSVYQEVKDYISTKMIIPPSRQIPQGLLEEAISMVRGSDKRTIKKWMNLFQKFHFIKWIAGRVWELN